MATRILGPVHVTRPMIEIITGAGSRALVRLHEHAPTPLRFIHDWRGVTGYEPTARRAILGLSLELVPPVRSLIMFRGFPGGTRAAAKRTRGLGRSPN